MKFSYVVIGAGLAGSTVAERIASQLNEEVLLIEKRKHIAGNCYDFYDEHGILVHKYGPHIFHTKIKGVWDYLLFQAMVSISSSMMMTPCRQRLQQ